MKKLSKANVSKLIVILSASLVLVATVFVCVFLGLFSGLKIDRAEVKAVENYQVRLYDAGVYGPYRALGKVDASGNLTDEDFKIISFTDTHLDTYTKKGEKTISHILANIQAEKPDLVIFVGDNVTSGMNWYRAKQFAEMMEEIGVYWCPVLGNHEGDNALSISRATYVDMWSKYEHCLMENDSAAVADGVWGNGNYVVNLVKSGGVITQSLIFMDSGDVISKTDAARLGVDTDSYDYIKPNQIEWYKGVLNRLAAVEQSQPIKSMLYFHIALQEFATAYDIVKEEELLPGQTASDGTTLYVFGKSYEKVAASDYNSGFFDVIVEGGNTQAIFCGHDHVNNYIVRYQDVYLVYVQKSGYSSYDLASKGLGDPNQGYTRTVIAPDGSFVVTHHLNG